MKRRGQAVDDHVAAGDGAPGAGVVSSGGWRSEWPRSGRAEAARRGVCGGGRRACAEARVHLRTSGARRKVCAGCPDGSLWTAPLPDRGS
eukprot:scaffold36189_cov62-Isochrysis_galbana.AAC.1